jgi:hypothetical protein
MSHSKAPNNTKPTRAKSGAKPRAKRGITRSASSRGGTKQEAVLTLLRQPKGATITAMMKATGGQQHGAQALDKVKSILMTLACRVVINLDRIDVKISRHRLASLLTRQSMDPPIHDQGLDHAANDVVIHWRYLHASSVSVVK